MKSTARKDRSKTTPVIPLESDAPPSAEDRLGYIATAAYFKAEARGFQPGQELDDWVAAEHEIGPQEPQ